MLTSSIELRLTAQNIKVHCLPLWCFYILYNNGLFCGWCQFSPHLLYISVSVRFARCLPHVVFSILFRLSSLSQLTYFLCHLSSSTLFACPSHIVIFNFVNDIPHQVYSCNISNFFVLIFSVRNYSIANTSSLYYYSLIRSIYVYVFLFISSS